MRTRKWLLTTVLCGGIMAAGGVGAGARASTGTLLQPNSDWAVSSLAATQAGGHPYCALARRFSNNLIFTLARNSQDESSVAIDFQKTALNNTETYHVTLKPGFGQDRAFNVRPVSGKALVIRLGQDYAFHDALNRSGKLEVDISGETYAFNVADFSDGQKKLSACLVNLVEPAAGSPADTAAMMPVPPAPAQSSYIIPASSTAPQAPVAAAPAPQVNSYVPDNSEAQALREENTRLRNALERERRTYEERYMQESQSSSMAAELNEKVRLLEMENGDLRQQLTYVPAAAPAAPEPLTCPKSDPTVMAALESELSNLRDENIRLKTNTSVGAALETELSALREENVRLRQQGSATNASLEGDLAALRDENLKLKQDVAAQQAKNATLEKQIAENAVPASADEAVVGALRQRVSSLENENKELKASNAALSKGGGDVPVSLAQLRSIEEQLRMVEQDRDKLLQQIDAVNQGKRESLLDISTENWDLEQATRRFNEAEREIQRLARQLEEQRTACASQKKELEYMLFDPGVAEQEQISKLITLEDQVKSAQAILDDQKANYELKLAELKDQAKSVEGKLEIQSAEYTQKLAVLEQELASRGNVSEEARNRIASLEGELAGLEQKSRAAETTVEIQKAEYQQKLALLEQQLASRGNASAEAQQRIASLEGELASIAQQKAAAETALAGQRAEYQQKLAGLEQELASRAAFTEESRQRIAMLEGEVETARVAAMQTASAELNTIRQERDELARQKAGIEAENSKLGGRIAMLESQLAEIETAAGQPVQDPVADARIAKLMQDNDILLEERNRLLAERDTLSGQHAALNEKIASLEGALASIPTGSGGPSTPEPVMAQQLEAREQESYEYAYKPEADSQYKDFGSSVQKTVEPAVSGTATMMSASALQTILGRAQIAVQGPIETSGSAGGREFVAYSWDTGTLFGSAEQQPISGINQFDKLAEAYIEKTRSRCQGEFAAVPVVSEQTGSLRVSAYEIACIAGNDGASAAIVFHGDEGKFTVIAHEAGLDGMEEAMDVRDRLVDVLMQTQIVSR